MIDAFCITRTRYFSMLRKERFGLTVTANITGFNLDDSVFGAIMIIAADNSSQTVNYALGDADAPRTFGSVPYSEIMTVIKTSKCRGVECGRHSQPGVSFSDKRQLSNMIWQYWRKVIYALPDSTAASVSGRRAKNVHALKT